MNNCELLSVKTSLVMREREREMLPSCVIKPQSCSWCASTMFVPQIPLTKTKKLIGDAGMSFANAVSSVPLADASHRQNKKAKAIHAFCFSSVLPPSTSAARCAAPVEPASSRASTPTTTASSTTRWRETAAAGPGRRPRRPTSSPPCWMRKPATRPSLLGNILTRWRNIWWCNLWILSVFIGLYRLRHVFPAWKHLEWSKYCARNW